MPTVPPTFISLDSDNVFIQHACVVSDVGDSLSGPTPDPDLDEGILVPVVTGDGVGAISSADSLADNVAAHSRSLKPRLSLADLSLHSPSSILGTPFDVSPRFEYPFPPTGASETDFNLSLSPSVSIMTSPFSPYPMHFSTLPPSLPLPRTEARSYSPTHPKLQPRDPPVPPTLAKKRWSNTMPSFSQSSPASHARKRSRSTVNLKMLVDGSDELIAGTPRETRAQAGGPSRIGATPSRGSSPPRDTRSRLGKERASLNASPAPVDAKPLPTRVQPADELSSAPLSDTLATEDQQQSSNRTSTPRDADDHFETQ